MQNLEKSFSFWEFEFKGLLEVWVFRDWPIFIPEILNIIERQFLIDVQKSRCWSGIGTYWWPVSKLSYVQGLRMRTISVCLSWICKIDLFPQWTCPQNITIILKYEFYTFVYATVLITLYTSSYLILVSVLRDRYYFFLLQDKKGKSYWVTGSLSQS